MPYHRRRRRMSSPRAVIQSFKKVLNFAGTSHVSNTVIQFPLSDGTDSVAAGQTGPIDPQVPTGSVIKYIEIQYSFVNLTSVSQMTHVAIQKLHAAQALVDPRLVGGNPQRNQVFFQQLFMVGKDQNSNHVYRFKVPKKYQRVREGDRWFFTVISDQVFSDALQCIYKFYR